MSKASMRLLSRDEIEQVHATSLRVLSEVGVKIDSPSVLALMNGAGANVDKTRKLVFLDERMVSAALKSAPRKVRICSRRGVDFSVPEEGVQLISPDGPPPAVLDIATGKKRPSK